MKIVFCSEPFEPKAPDYSYKEEYEAALRAGFETALFSYEDLCDGAVSRAFGRISTDQAQHAIYRGWMLRAEQYDVLFSELAQRGLTLLNTPEMYRHCHHFPASYHQIKEHTPKSVVIPVTLEFRLADVHDRLAEFGVNPLIVKDYVKSRKHEWKEACFIPSAADRDTVERVTAKFIELQGSDLTGGLVFREFCEFEQIGTHSRSGLPLFNEYRLFYEQKNLLFEGEYWDEADYSAEEEIPYDHFTALAEKIESNFFTMDIAKTSKGEWLVVELGDGQTAGLPRDDMADGFYRALAAQMLNT